VESRNAQAGPSSKPKKQPKTQKATAGSLNLKKHKRKKLVLLGTNIKEGKTTCFFIKAE
jgi:hypothetical protein